MQAKWMWYPGDWEIYVGSRVMQRREQQEKAVAPMWRLDLPHASVFYKKKVNLPVPERVQVVGCGTVSVRCGGDVYAEPEEGDYYTLLAGEYEILITVMNPGGLPAVYVDGASVKSGADWLVCPGQFGYPDLPAAVGEFEDPLHSPEQYRLATEPQEAVSVERTEEGYFVDFGQETFGYLKLDGIKKAGKVRVYYGESEEEAHSDEFAELRDTVSVQAGSMIFLKSRALRYARIICDMEIERISLLYEYLPVTYRGKFRCSDETLNRIYDVSCRTFHLCSRETFLDGIKRDRWFWSGDAYQSYLMNYYSFFDRDINHRTMWALRGQEPVEAHISLIVDYSFYWLISLYDHYLYMGDTDFIRQIFPRAESLLSFCESRLNEDGFIEGVGSDWVFLDWADMDMSGSVCAEQILFYQSYVSMAQLSTALFGSDNGYQAKADAMKERIMNTFWDNERGVFYHSVKDGKPTEKITRYAGIFALLYDFVDKEKREKIVKNMLMNDAVQAITTPYAKFFELSALCLCGKTEEVTARMKAYWGGMLDLGATSFWEEYVPTATEHYSMYGRPFSKSLCHAWGASPLYLLGRFYLGVVPTKPAYASYTVTPVIGAFTEMEGSVPMPDGEITVSVKEGKITVRATGQGEGTLQVGEKSYPIPKDRPITVPIA